MKSVVLLGVTTAAAIFISLSPALADRREGRISWKRCPHSCATEHLNKKDCRDWRQGDVCMVEDLTKPRQPGVREDTDGRIGDNEYPGPNTFRLASPTSTPPSSTWQPPAAPPPVGAAAPSDCTGPNSRYIRRPRVDVYDIKSRGNIFGSKYRVRGSIEGTCISEAAYFESGRSVEPIQIITTPEFRRFEFEVTINGDDRRSPEIRAYATNGERDEIDLGRLVEKEFGNGGGGW